MSDAAASPESRTVLYVEPSVVASHTSSVSFQRSATALAEPRFTSNPASSVGVAEAARLELSVMILSARLIVSVFTVVVVPETVRSPSMTALPETVRSLPMITSFGKPTVIVLPLPAPVPPVTSTSFAVPSIVNETLPIEVST